MNPSVGREENRLRVNLYLLLAALLSGPPPEALLQLLANIQAGALAGDSALQDGWQDLYQAAATCSREEIDEEFHRLFIGLGRGEVVPYGSWYLAGRLMDKPLARLRDDLALLGIERRPANRETEDHAAALCETMALIGDPQAQAPRPRQQRFFNAHLAAWMPRFFKDLQMASSARFYGAVGRFGEAFMDAERKAFGATTGHAPLQASGAEAEAGAHNAQDGADKAVRKDTP